MSRIVAIGDVHGAVQALRAILRGTRLADRNDHWVGGRSHLVQIGDIFNRGTDAREAFELLRRLAVEAGDAGGAVTMLTGNHDVMMATGNEAYSRIEEYLAFASARERERWHRRVDAEPLRLLRAERDSDHVLPLWPRIEAWKLHHVPGRDALRRALGPRGRIGRAIRRQPIAVRIDDALFVHAGVSERWARMGVDELNRLAAEAWRRFDRRRSRAELARTILGVQDGPLWYRPYAWSRDPDTGRSLAAALSLLGARRMVAGHSRTWSMPGGQRGRIHTRFRTRYVGIDVHLRDDDPVTWAALVIDGRGGWEWRYRSTARRRLWARPG